MPDTTRKRLAPVFCLPRPRRVDDALVGQRDDAGGHSQAEMTSIQQQPSGSESKGKGRGRQNDGRGGGRGRGGGEQPAGGGAATGVPPAAVKAAPQLNGSVTQGTEGNSVRERTPEPAAQTGR